MRHRQRAVDVRSEIFRAALQVLEGNCRLEVVRVEIEAAQHNTDIWIKHTAVRDVREVLRLDISAEGWVCATNVWNTLSFKLLLYTRLSQYEDLVLWGGQLENAVDVDGSAVRGPEDFVLMRL